MAKTQRNFVLGRMNKSLDERLLKNGEYIDAQNVRLGSTEEAEVGSVENAKGNTQLTELYFIDPLTEQNVPLSSEARTIGTFEDGANETLYWFVHDPSFPLGNTGKLDMICSFNTLSSRLKYHIISIDDGGGVQTTLNFNPQFLITGVNLVGNLLFFTDFLNPPRFINTLNSYKEPISVTQTSSGTTAFVFTAGSYAGSASTESSFVTVGYHSGTITGCPTPLNAIGTGVAPTTTQINLPGTGCYTPSTTIPLLGPPIPNYNLPQLTPGFGIQGANAASVFALTQFIQFNDGTGEIGIIMSSGGNNPGRGVISGTITGSDGSSGTYVGQYGTVAEYVDDNGVPQNPESTGNLRLVGITLKDSITYTLTI